MVLATGTRLGSYEIVGELGAGGMGEVYRAIDARLKREVAVKVLPPAFAADTDRLARFQREAEVLASLNHPNIAQVYGLEQSDGTSALILELVEGPTLAERLEQGPIPPDETLSIAVQIADALEAAHSRGIVHRDLKPANVKLRPDGTVKVLDFGIAKAIERQPASGPQAPLTTPAMTQAGVLLGTAAYMAPEQARGKPVDQRADIWAFGCVLYEMFTGQPAFGGEDVPMTLARVLANDSDLETMPSGISTAVRHTIKLCLEKDPRKRIADIRDVKLALAGAFESVPASERRGAGSSSRAARWLAPAVAAALGGGVAFAFYELRSSAPEVRQVERFALEVPDGGALGIDSESTSFAISPDGTQIVFPLALSIDNYSWYLRRIGELDARPLLVGGDGGRFGSPFFSADGAWIGFEFQPAIGRGRSLVRMPSSGGPAIAVGNLPGGGSTTELRGASWGDDNTILFSVDTHGLWRVPAGGGEPEQLTTPEPGVQHRWPHWLPGGRAALFSIFENGLPRIALLDVDSREIRDLIPAGSAPSYSPTGHVVYAASDGSLLAVAFDLASLAVGSDPVPVLDGVARATLTSGAHYALAGDGSIVYATGLDNRQTPSQLVWVTRDGREELIGAPTRQYAYANVSPDGQRIALDIRGGESDIWIWDIARATLARLTADDGPNPGIAWSPDSRYVAFRAGEEIVWQAADGSSPAQRLVASNSVPSHITADHYLLYNEDGPSGRDVFVKALDDPNSEPKPLLASSAAELNASVSPNGAFVAYQSLESGRSEIYVRPFPDVSSGRWQISTAGGTRPIWRGDGAELFYYAPEDDLLFSTRGAVMAVPVEYDPVFRAGGPQQLFAGGYEALYSGLHVYDVTPDGQRFVMIKSAADGAASEQPRRLVLVKNWAEELKRVSRTNQ